MYLEQNSYKNKYNYLDNSNHTSMNTNGEKNICPNSVRNKKINIIYIAQNL